MNSPHPGPIAAVSMAVVRDEHVLLVRRGRPPGAGQLALPGGHIRWGETLHQAACRELLEETGLHAEPVQLLTAVDLFNHDTEGRLNSHYLLVTLLCRWLGGRERAGSDAAALLWLDSEALQQREEEIVPPSAEVARLALSLG